jgi:hypothetical protein
MTKEEFVKCWNNSTSVDEVIGLTGLTYYACTKRASYLRSKGYKLKKLYRPKGSDYWKIIGRKGGSTPTDLPKGFAAMTKAEASRLGKIGGTISKRGKSKVNRVRRPR